MKRVAKSLESLVGRIAQLEATAALAKGITDKDLEALVSRDPIRSSRLVLPMLDHMPALVSSRSRYLMPFLSLR